MEVIMGKKLKYQDILENFKQTMKREYEAKAATWSEDLSALGVDLNTALHEPDVEEKIYSLRHIVMFLQELVDEIINEDEEERKE